MPNSPSWYLDPIVARQKREIHQRWIYRSLGGNRPACWLKTDLFEEANGQDQIFYDLLPETTLKLGIDLCFDTVRRAYRATPGFGFLVCDARQLAFAPGSLDLIVSNSTLDHFQRTSDLQLAIEELARALRPGGRLLITLDNPLNPLYHLLRWGSRNPRAPVYLGATASASQLERLLTGAGLRVEKTEYLIHNPRIVSTILFLSLRRLLGPAASPLIGAALAVFSALGHLPTAPLTACFVAACALKPR